MPTLRFTGSRTGLDGIWLPKYGAVERGAEIDVPADVADRWLVPPSDFELVGDVEDVDAIWASVDYPSEPEPEVTPEATAAPQRSTRRKRTKTKVDAGG